jgi:hypothetical protein
MKTQKLFLIAALLIGFFLVTCSKKKETDIKPRLFITLKDTSGNAVSGALVRLYKNVTDTGITKISDSTGVVIFTGLEPTVYYWLATKGCKTNRNSQTTLNRDLITNAVLYGYSIMSETGTLIITNSSTEPYKVTDSVFTATVYIDTPYISWPKIGSYLIHSEKLSTPGTGKDTLIQINCSDTAVIRLPY